MNKKKIIIASIVSLLLISTASVFAWFYFPNSKGLEIDTAPALDFDIEVYKLINEYDEKGNYSGSHLDNLTTIGSYEDSEGNTVNYLNTTTGIFSIPESFEFYQWGDEFICEDTDPHYYALKISYDSDAYQDGYLNSIISATLESLGTFTVEGVTTDASFPIIKTSYKYASSATIMNEHADAMTEMKNNGYQEIINGTDYYTKSGDNYILVDRSTEYSNSTTYYKTDISRIYGNISDFTNVYTYNNLTHTYEKANNYIANTQYYRGTFTTVNIDGYAMAEDSYSLAYLNYDINTILKDDLEQAQYLISTTKTIQFVLYIKLEPDEAIVTSKMEELEDKVGDLTEIKISNTLTLDLKLRSIPHKEGTISNN